MTIFEKFVSFAQGLPADRREAVEAGLAALMESYSAEYEFTPQELAEIDSRFAEPKPQYSDPGDNSRLFGKPFSA